MSDAAPADAANADAARDQEQIPPDEATTEPLPEAQPESQGEDPLDAELGEDGQGDLAPEDEPAPSGDGPNDLRTSVREDTERPS